MNETQLELIRIRAEELSKAEANLIAARKKYNRALRNWEASAQTKLSLEKE
jgi:hypothetical protein